VVSRGKVSFKAKALSKLGINQVVLLKETTLLTSTHNALLASLRDDYLNLDDKSNVYEKAFLTLLNAILTQERVYFALSRRSMQELMRNDLNFKNPEAFSNNSWAAILAKFYNQFKVIRLIKQGTTRTASAFEVIHPEILTHLSHIDKKSQKEKTMAFCTNVPTKS
jgi:hypothetical protein